MFPLSPTEYSTLPINLFIGPSPIPTVMPRSVCLLEHLLTLLFSHSCLPPLHFTEQSPSDSNWQLPTFSLSSAHLLSLKLTSNSICEKFFKGKNTNQLPFHTPCGQWFCFVSLFLTVSMLAHNFKTRQLSKPGTWIYT